MAARKQISLRFHDDPDISRSDARQSKVGASPEHLITNAVKFSNPGSSVDVAPSKSGVSVVLSVRDHGQGIPSHDIDKLFKSFQRTSVKSTGGEESTGLGLAIVRKIVIGHKGKVWVESEIGKGSTFYVSLPCSIG